MHRNSIQKSRDQANGESEEAKDDVPSILNKRLSFFLTGGGEGDEKFLKIRRDVYLHQPSLLPKR